MVGKPDEQEEDDVLAIPIVNLPADLPANGPITFAALRKHSEKFIISVEPDEMGQLIVKHVYPRNVEEVEKVGEVIEKKSLKKFAPLRRAFIRV